MKKLLKKIRKDLTILRNEFRMAYDNRKSITIRPYRCGQNAEYLARLIKKIDKLLK